MTWNICHLAVDLKYDLATSLSIVKSSASLHTRGSLTCIPQNSVSFTSRTRTEMHSRRKHKNSAHCFLYKKPVCVESYYKY